MTTFTLYEWNILLNKNGETCASCAFVAPSQEVSGLSAHSQTQPVEGFDVFLDLSLRDSNATSLCLARTRRHRHTGCDDSFPCVCACLCLFAHSQASVFVRPSLPCGRSQAASCRHAVGDEQATWPICSRSTRSQHRQMARGRTSGSAEARAQGNLNVASLKHQTRSPL